MLRSRVTIGILLLVAGGCASHDESLGCAELVVSCPAGTEQRWWLANTLNGEAKLQVQDGRCGSWLAYISEGAYATYDNVDLGIQEGETRLRVLVSANDAVTTGGTLTLFADSDTTASATCTVPQTGGWFNWVVVDCGPLLLGGRHSLTFTFSGSAQNQYFFNFAAFGIVRSGAPDCTVTGPQR